MSPLLELGASNCIGYEDPKADRNRRKLVLVSRRVPRGHKISEPVKGLATFPGLWV
jgi:hypothetical protein